MTRNSIGRTGRAGKTGISVTFMRTDETRLAQALIKILGDAKQPVPEQLAELASFGGGGAGGGSELSPPSTLAYVSSILTSIDWQASVLAFGNRFGTTAGDSNGGGGGYAGGRRSNGFDSTGGYNNGGAGGGYGTATTNAGSSWGQPNAPPHQATPVAASSSWGEPQPAP